MAVECKCKTCNKIFFKNKYAVEHGEGKFCSKDCHIKNQKIEKKGILPEWLRIACKTPWNKGKIGYQAGENHYNWKGGITSKNKSFRCNIKWKEWRESVFERDNYTCQKCGSKSGLDGYVRLEPHHIFRLNKLIKNNFLNHIYNPDNGITLCIKCHKTTFKGNF